MLISYSGLTRILDEVSESEQLDSLLVTNFLIILAERYPDIFELASLYNVDWETKSSVLESWPEKF